MNWFKKLFKCKLCESTFRQYQIDQNDMMAKALSDLKVINTQEKSINELEKELAFWKEKALNYRKPHSHQ